MPEVNGDADDWVRVDNARDYERGGLLPMAVFLTQNAPGLRTSPVKRGYWVVRRVLGEVIPPPPPTVPELPKDEAKLGPAAARDAGEAPRQSGLLRPATRASIRSGLTFEGYGPVGETRDERPGRTRRSTRRRRFPAAAREPGSTGLQSYIRAQPRKGLCGQP